MLERLCHADANFLTLTYTDENIPDGGNLHPQHLSQYIKRLRKLIAPMRLRYYGVGEYGDENWRPHYHVAVFGVAGCIYGQTRERTHLVGKPCCDNCDLLQKPWHLGAIFSGTLELSSAQYIAGYTVKKMTAPDDPRLNGLHPEFARMSNRPGIGRDAMWDVASTLLEHGLDETEIDVPTSLRHGRKIYPLGRYLTRNLREMVGKDPGQPQKANDEIQKNMLPLQQAARSSEEEPSLKAQILKASKGKRASLAAKEKIYTRKKSL